MEKSGLNHSLFSRDAQRSASWCLNGKTRSAARRG